MRLVILFLLPIIGAVAGGIVQLCESEPSWRNWTPDLLASPDLELMALLGGAIGLGIGVVFLLFADLWKSYRDQSGERQVLGLSAETRRKAATIHLSGLSALAFPPAGFLAPLILWIRWRENLPFIEFHAKEAINFQLTAISLGTVIGALIWTIDEEFWIALAVLIVLWIWSVMRASVKATEGRIHRYRLAIPIIGTPSTKGLELE